MSEQPARVRVLKMAMVFTVFMFVGQPLFVVALILLLGAVLAELKSRELF